MKTSSPVTPLRHGTLHFFDTNFLLTPAAATLPQVNRESKPSRWITETTRQEVYEKLGEQSTGEILDGKFDILLFNDIYRQNPGICPVYYWYILSMYNPANLGSEEFIEEAYISKFIKGDNITDEDRKIYEKTRRFSSRGQVLDPTGKPKAELLRYLEDLQANMSKKAKKAVQDRHPSYLRDIRTLSLILYHTLTTKMDTIFYTTDGDAIPLLFKWLESMSMRAALNHAILPKIDSVERLMLSRGEKVEFYLDYKDFVHSRYRIYKDLVNDQWKEACVNFKIRRWNQLKLSFEHDVWLTFPDDIADYFSNLHGNLWCHFTKNDTHGNWLRFLYYWPPAKPGETRLRVEVTMKPLFRTSSLVTSETHEKKCRYRKDDASGKIASWSEFV